MRHHECLSFPSCSKHRTLSWSNSAFDMAYINALLTLVQCSLVCGWAKDLPHQYRCTTHVFLCLQSNKWTVRVRVLSIILQDAFCLVISPVTSAQPTWSSTSSLYTSHAAFLVWRKPAFLPSADRPKSQWNCDTQNIQRELAGSVDYSARKPTVQTKVWEKYQFNLLNCRSVHITRRICFRSLQYTGTMPMQSLHCRTIDFGPASKKMTSALKSLWTKWRRWRGPGKGHMPPMLKCVSCPFTKYWEK